MAEVSAQMVNTIEGGRTWVSDKTLVSLARVLGVEVFQLFTPGAGTALPGGDGDGAFLRGVLDNLQRNLKDDIDRRFARFTNRGREV